MILVLKLLQESKVHQVIFLLLRLLSLLNLVDLLPHLLLQKNQIRMFKYLEVLP